jgi:uncharacterized protein
VPIFLPIAEIPVDLFLVIGIGAAVGFVSGLFGVGGGFLMTPFLIFIGVPPAVAVATGAMQIAASATTASLHHWRKKSLDVRLALTLTVGGAVGTILGVLIFNRAKSLGQLDLVIQLSYVTLMLTIGGLMLFDYVRSFFRERGGKVAPRPRGGAEWAAALPPRISFARSQLTLSLAPLLLLGAGIGMLGALIGIGGGFMTVPALIYLFRVPASVVVGTSMLQILITMLAATVMHAVTNGSVDLLLGLILTIGGVVGAQFGARAGAHLRSDVFRLFLALLVLAVGLRFAVQLATPPDLLFSLVPG